MFYFFVVAPPVRKPNAASTAVHHAAVDEHAASYGLSMLTLEREDIVMGTSDCNGGHGFRAPALGIGY